MGSMCSQSRSSQKKTSYVNHKMCFNWILDTKKGYKF